MRFFGDLGRNFDDFWGFLKDLARIFEDFWGFLKLRKIFFTNDELNDTLRRVAGTGSRALKQTAGSRWSSSTESDCG